MLKVKCDIDFVTLIVYNKQHNGFNIQFAVFEVMITNYVDAIKSKKHIENMKDTLKNKCFRDYLMFVMGINTGLKVSELLNLKFSDVMYEGKIKAEIEVHNKKYYINNCMSDDLYSYYAMLNVDDEERYLFEKGIGKSPIGRSHAYRILNDVALELDIDANIGMHTLRKTYGYHYYKQFGDIKYLQKLFNHSAPSITLKYIGVSSETKTFEDIKNFEL